MRAYELPRGCRSVDELRIVQRPDPVLRPGQVLVRLRAVSLNRRDQAVALGTYFGKPVSRDLIPLSDGAGEVLAVADDVTRFRAGDRVVASYLQTPPSESPFAAPQALGSPLDGTLAGTIALYENGLLPVPAHLSFEEAACLPCAAVTAWNALMVAGRQIGAGDTVLVLGTGGVSIFALQFAVAAGARVIATTSSDEKIERLKALGASSVVNYVRTPDWPKEVMALTDGHGADCVVEIGGVGTLERSIDSTAVHGKIALIGVLTGRSAPLNPYALMWKEATIHGIRVGSVDSFREMNRAIAVNHVKPVIDTVFPFDEAVAGYHHLASGQFVGKIVVAGSVRL